MSERILWYVHDHGRGHLDRARAVIPRLSAPVVVAAAPRVAADADRVLDATVIRLPDDVGDTAACTVGPWHHAPAGTAVRARALAIADAVRTHDCTTAVVDVSMEATVLSRLLGLRVVTLRQSGRRDDAAHRTGLASADRVWVPQHRDLEPHVDDADDRWMFSGSFSRFDGVRVPDADVDRWSPGDGIRLAVIVLGAGGTAFPMSSWCAGILPDGWNAVIVGHHRRWARGRVASIGRLEALLPLLTAADLLITSSGWGSVADAVAAGVERLVVVPEDRPFDEQRVRAAALQATGLAVRSHGWPVPSDLGALDEQAAHLDHASWSHFHDGHGAQRAAALIDEVHAA
ncbi:MAG: hypothetical protein M3337_01725 [Actinomycetota bacterium]|nr:hypothetical protein [Actinomycetota bacterium]